MKVFFGLLLIVNIAFAAFQWFIPYEQLFGESRKVPAGEQLKLLSEANVAEVSQQPLVHLGAIPPDEDGLQSAQLLATLARLAASTQSTSSGGQPSACAAETPTVTTGSAVRRRARLCIQPRAQSWRMPASTMG